MSLDKQSIRSKMRAFRRQLPEYQQQVAAQQLLAMAQSLTVLQNAQRIGAYSAWDGEINPQQLLSHLQKTDKEIYLPRLSDNKQLLFGPWLPSAMHYNRYGIPEPNADGPLHTALEMDVVLVPCVAFTRHGERLGMGGGYYDRTIANCRSQGTGPSWLLLAYAFQEVEALPKEPWDQAVDGIISDQEFIAIR